MLLKCNNKKVLQILNICEQNKQMDQHFFFASGQILHWTSNNDPAQYHNCVSYKSIQNVLKTLKFIYIINCRFIIKQH